eukprot:6949488-Karenia_brevis.AAC.1
MWDCQVGAIQNPSIQCWVFGQLGHMGRNCLSKGLRKGGPPAGERGPPVGPKGFGKGGWGATPWGKGGKVSLE